MGSGGGPAGSGSNGGGALDPDLRERMDAAIAEFQKCYDAAAAQPTAGNLEALREATDRLVRAGSRVLIELNRS